jgi:signal transduction histidine kinase/DNA-binding NarL/FixJ family response regulator
MTSTEVTEELQARVLWSRTRMLFSHVPVASMVCAAFAVLLVALVNHMHPLGASTATLAWLVITLTVSILRTHHALIYFQSRERQLPHWRRGFMVYTGLFSLCWASAIWVLPLSQRADLQAILLGSLAGISASGALMMSADRIGARLWVAPILLSCAAFSANLTNAYGLFGVASMLGFMGILLMESERSHRRLGELLHFRFQSDHIAQARAQALNEAQQLSMAKGRFLATMSHEMRTPLHGILGLSRLIRPEITSQEAHQRLNLLQGAGQHLLHVINDVLDFSRLQAGKMEFNLQRINLWQLVREVAGVAEVSAIEKGVAIVLDAGACEDTWVEADADRLRQVLHNLLGNAVKFTERGAITVRLCMTGAAQQSGRDWFVLEVKDTGIGIAPQELGRVFQAFHQSPGSSERQIGGSGLGLTIARQLCMAMDGELSCDSQVGLGSVFRCTVPLKVTGAPAGLMTQVALGGLGTWPVAVPIPEPKSTLLGTVLLVEDNPVNAHVAKAELEQLGLSVALADNGRQALEWLSLHQPDLVLMDCHMPEMDGFEATKRIREIESQRGAAPMPIIALTASAQVEDRRACLAAGMDDHLGKPFAHGELVRVVRKYLLRNPGPMSAGLALPVSSDTALHQARQASAHVVH